MSISAGLKTNRFAVVLGRGFALAMERVGRTFSLQETSSPRPPIGLWHFEQAPLRRQGDALFIQTLPRVSLRHMRFERSAALTRLQSGSAQSAATYGMCPGQRERGSPVSRRGRERGPSNERWLQALDRPADQQVIVEAVVIHPRPLRSAGSGRSNRVARPRPAG